MDATPKPAAPPMPEPTALEIATLAASLLPPMRLPEDWETPKYFEALAEDIGQATSGKWKTYQKDYQYPPGWLTPYEVVAAEATKRARILLAAAAGQVRPERTDWVEGLKRAGEEVREQSAARKALQPDFDRLAEGRTTLLLMEVLKYALPGVYKHNPENAFHYWREYIIDSVVSLRIKHKLPAIKVVLKSESTAEEIENSVDGMAMVEPPATCVLPHDKTYLVDRDEFPFIVYDIKDFYHGPQGKAIAKLLAAKAGEKGGRKAQQAARPTKLPANTGAKLRKAAKKVQKKQSGA